MVTKRNQFHFIYIFNSYKKLGILICLFLFLHSCKSDRQLDKKFAIKFTKNQKLYFVETAYDKGVNHKWVKGNITYALGSKFEPSEQDFIKKTMDYISSLKNLPQMRLTEGHGDITFYKPTTTVAFNNLAKDAYLWRGFTRSEYNLDNTPKKSDIFIKTDQTNLNIEITIQHELMHTLGLLCHPNTKFLESSALGRRFFNSSDPKILPNLPELDSKALIILYDKRFLSRSKQTEAKEILGLK
ncbi:hypothetical protein ASE74_08835 [Pedobacter sp. Leaf216]|uniref:hypothetical protein n=1 Tax=Pedobacter sp. Leaf216 TaxID=1735684 RepID=UPI0006F5C4AB|nr:hypothetical protein [Pedobacter sp. Leaf216]KQM66492.1 hypothetical protein ASE74_08835 [Pedobacter sp. Leaf216]